MKKIVNIYNNIFTEQRVSDIMEFVGAWFILAIAFSAVFLVCGIADYAIKNF